MAISRAQMLKELLPGLNALFGLEYAKYEDEDKMVYETETSDRSFEEEVKLGSFNPGSEGERSRSGGSESDRERREGRKKT